MVLDIKGDENKAPLGDNSIGYTPTGKEASDEDSEATTGKEESDSSKVDSDFTATKKDRPLNNDGKNSSLLGKIGKYAIIGLVGGGIGAGVYGYNKGYNAIKSVDIKSIREPISFKYGDNRGVIKLGMIEIDQGKGKEVRKESLVNILRVLSELKTGTNKLCNPIELMGDSSKKIIGTSGLYEGAKKLALLSTGEDKEFLEKFQDNYEKSCYKDIGQELIDGYKIVNIL